MLPNNNAQRQLSPQSCLLDGINDYAVKFVCTRIRRQQVIT